MNFGLRGVTAAALFPRCMRPGTGAAGEARWGFGIGWCRGSVRQLESGAAALLKAGFASCKPDALIALRATFRNVAIQQE